jgi:class 3 adenylate cyclase
MLARRTVERRQLSVMFCDLIGSTRLAMELGAETYGEVVGAYQACAGAALARFGGYIAQHQGDGLLVYFGWPQAGEDDAERAVRAGLHVLESLHALRAELGAAHGVALDVRLALHSGMVVLGELGAGTRREVLALGDNASLAARLQELAPANGLLISDATLALARGAFETWPLGELAPRGFSRPVRVHQVLCMR